MAITPRWERSTAPRPDSSSRCSRIGSPKCQGTPASMPSAISTAVIISSASWARLFFPSVCHRRNVAEDLLIAVNPEQDSSLPYLVRIPLGDSGIVLKTRDTWPRTTKLYCHRADGWPASAEIIERLPVRSCTQRGAAIDLIVDRPRLSRSQFVITRARGREMIFWQSPKTTKQARAGIHIPTARAHGQVLEIFIDSGEKYPYDSADNKPQRFANGCPAATTRCAWTAPSWLWSSARLS